MNAFIADGVAFRPVQADDLAMLAGWMARPHWREWWGEPETEIGHVRDMVEGHDPTCQPFLFDCDGVEGYIQVWRIGPHQIPAWTGDNPWLIWLPSDAVGVDLSVASADALSKGVGSRVLKAFAGRLAEEGHGFIIIDPDPANHRAVRAYRKAGFHPMPELDGQGDDVLIMRYHQGSERP